MRALRTIFIVLGVGALLLAGVGLASANPADGYTCAAGWCVSDDTVRDAARDGSIDFWLERGGLPPGMTTYFNPCLTDADLLVTPACRSTLETLIRSGVFGKSYVA